MKNIETIEYAIHSATGLFPPMSDEDFAQLKADIQQNGQKMPILVYRNKIVDGRERLRACRELGIDPRFDDVGKLDVPTQTFIVSQNLHRRHLSDSQRALIAGELSNTKKGANQHTAEAVSQKQAAAACKVSIDSVGRAKAVLNCETPGLAKVVRDGNLDVSTAALLSQIPKAELDRLVKEKVEVMKEEARKLRLKKTEEKRKESVDRIAKRTVSQSVKKAIGPFNVIYVDAPWDAVDERGLPIMSRSDLELKPVQQLSGDDTMLFLWVPDDRLEDGFKVLAAWGFRYRTHAVWNKGGKGAGPYFHVNHELLLFATRGEVPMIPTAARVVSVLDWQTKGKQRPQKVYDLIDSMFPELSKIELFPPVDAAARAGWYDWNKPKASKTKLLKEKLQNLSDSITVDYKRLEVETA
ncbi:Spo0J and IME4 domain-containing protein [Burkholderia cepacia]|uniref:Spo0J and IME4 domain-containing protein n=1 Tax=Burkholderia cepacia TaxID=292 RepID=UPI000F5E56F1|nr:MT-A70 family methyltransferase [Burkholderia cepacia]RQT37037.1 S-adenosylmethionine-binding protein [Burkholderia cepacia]